MKARTFILAMVVVLAFSVPCFGKVWHVNNNAGVVRDFATPQEAHDSEEVLAGDTLYVYGSPTNYGDFTLSKQLHVIGPGYFLGENLETQTGPNMAQIGSIICETGSEGSSFEGIAITSPFSANVDNIVMLRNLTDFSGCKGCIRIGQGVSGTILHQNYFSHHFQGEINCVNGIVINIGNDVQNCLITNNVIRQYSTSKYAYSIKMTDTASATIENNLIFDHILRIRNSDFHNNILYSGVLDENNCTITNNIDYSDQLGTENGNQLNVDMSTVFVGTGSKDGKWQLKEDSPAIGAGLNGEDCGIFGGDSPYMLSGLPPIPAIHHFSAPTIGSNMSGLPVKIKMKAHD